VTGAKDNIKVSLHALHEFREAGELLGNVCAAYGALDREPPRAAGYVHSPPTLETQRRIYAVRKTLLAALAEESAI
jgi:hypothetical protein